LLDSLVVSEAAGHGFAPLNIAWWVELRTVKPNLRPSSRELGYGRFMAQSQPWLAA
jgi:hypothetical protein